MVSDFGETCAWLVILSSCRHPLICMASVLSMCVNLIKCSVVHEDTSCFCLVIIARLLSPDQILLKLGLRELLSRMVYTYKLLSQLDKGCSVINSKYLEYLGTSDSVHMRLELALITDTWWSLG